MLSTLTFRLPIFQCLLLVLLLLLVRLPIFQCLLLLLLLLLGSLNCLSPKVAVVHCLLPSKPLFVGIHPIPKVGKFTLNRYPCQLLQPILGSSLQGRYSLRQQGGFDALTTSSYFQPRHRSLVQTTTSNSKLRQTSPVQCCEGPVHRTFHKP